MYYPPAYYLLMLSLIWIRWTTNNQNLLDDLINERYVTCVPKESERDSGGDISAEINTPPTSPVYRYFTSIAIYWTSVHSFLSSSKLMLLMRSPPVASSNDWVVDYEYISNNIASHGWETDTRHHTSARKCVGQLRGATHILPDFSPNAPSSNRFMHLIFCVLLLAFLYFLCIK